MVHTDQLLASYWITISCACFLLDNTCLVLVVFLLLLHLPLGKVPRPDSPLLQFSQAMRDDQMLLLVVRGTGWDVLLVSFLLPDVSVLVDGHRVLPPQQSPGPRVAVVESGPQPHLHQFIIIFFFFLNRPLG